MYMKNILSPSEVLTGTEGNKLAWPPLTLWSYTDWTWVEPRWQVLAPFISVLVQGKLFEMSIYSISACHVPADELGLPSVKRQSWRTELMCELPGSPSSQHPLPFCFCFCTKMMFLLSSQPLSCDFVATAMKHGQQFIFLFVFGKHVS